MFKLVVVSALFAVAVAAPSGWHAPAHVVHSVPSHVTYEHVHGVAEVGKIVDHVPTGVSHSSSSVVHSHGSVVTPIVAPVHKTIVAHAAPVVHHHGIVAHAAPVVQHHEIVAHAAPAHVSYEHVHGVAEVGHIVDHVPTSVSHSSSSVVHGHGSVVTPIVAPVHKTIVAHAAPVVHHHESYHHAAPVHSVYHAAPAVHHAVHEPVWSVEHAPLVHSVSHW